MFFVFVFAVAGMTVSAQTTEPVVDTTGEPRFVIRLPRISQTLFPEYDTLDVTVFTRDAELGGFDLKIATDSRVMSIVDILPGTLNDSCGWEYFAARDLGMTLGEQGLVSLWKLVGLARSADDTLSPRCDTLPGGVSLARLVVSFSPVVQPRDTIAELFFWWESCVDNTVSASSGRRMSISRQVHDYEVSDRERVGGFPTRTGAPKTCVKPNAPYRPLRQIDFHNGGVRLRLPELPARSDSAGNKSFDTTTSDK